MRTLLEQSWTDVLALTMLRHGENSTEYSKQLDIVDKLIASSVPTKAGKLKPLSPALRTQVAASLSEVGLDKDDIRSLTEHLFGAASEEDGLSRTELAMRFKNKPRLGSEVEHPPLRQPAPKPKVRAELTAEEKETLQHLKTLP